MLSRVIGGRNYKVRSMTWYVLQHDYMDYVYGPETIHLKYFTTGWHIFADDEMFPACRTLIECALHMDGVLRKWEKEFLSQAGNTS